MRLAVDTGGTFTDLVVDNDGQLDLFKSPTTPHNPVEGVLAVLFSAAEKLGVSRRAFLNETELFIHGTTRAINAVLTGATAKTALLATQGHPDILLFREGGRSDPFNWTVSYPEPYVPRSLTFEVPERVGSRGEIVVPLDEDAVREILDRMRGLAIEAVAVCFLWSTVNPAHERRVGELLGELLPDVPFTLSHELNPILREYRRASSTAIDASLKPVMSEYLSELDTRLRDGGFGGRLLMSTSGGGMLDAADMVRAPIHSLGSGPAMAPISGRYFARADASGETAIVTDTGGTSYDVSLVRGGEVPWTLETWLGPAYMGHLTGFPSVDVKSIGAGGGSIAWVDRGGLLHVGPQSAGAVPGPVCYAQGGTEPTVTDAAVVLGYIDPSFFLGGEMRLDGDAAAIALARSVGEPLGLEVEAAAAAVLRLATEHMARAIEEITINQGIDPRHAVLVGGGGAAGLNAVAIARRLGCPRVVVPEFGAVLSAAGALMSDLAADFAATFPTSTTGLDFEGFAAVSHDLIRKSKHFLQGAGTNAEAHQIDLAVEARYPHQNWEIEVPLRQSGLGSPDDVETFLQDFHAVHERLFAFSDRDAPVEIVGVRAHARCRLGAQAAMIPHPKEGSTMPQESRTAPENRTRRVYFESSGHDEAQVIMWEEMPTVAWVPGPLIVESGVTVVVVDRGARAQRRPSGTIVIIPSPESGPLRPDEP